MDALWDAVSGGRALPGAGPAALPARAPRPERITVGAAPAEIPPVRRREPRLAARAVAVLALAAALLAGCLSEDRDAPPVFGEERALFDGKTLAGWGCFLADPAVRCEDVWSVEDGVLACRGTPAGYLYTEEEYESFELTLEWRFDPAKGPGNSGVLLRTTGEHRVWPRSIEAQLHHRDAGDIWNIGEVPMQPDPARTQGRRTVKAAPSSERPIGEWNRYRITLDRGELRLEVNGVLQNVAGSCEERPGRICLQSEGAEIQFRDLRLRPILR